MRRCAFLKSTFMAAAAFGAARFALAKKGQPNILFIISDDQCYETIREFGLVDINTPNLDRLVKHGTSFLHAYNMGSFSGAVYVASRTMLNTGSSVWNSQRIFNSVGEYLTFYRAGFCYPQPDMGLVFRICSFFFINLTELCYGELAESL